ELSARRRHIPVIVLATGDSGELAAPDATPGIVDRLDAGELCPALLRQTIRHSVQAASQLQSLHESEKRLRQLERMGAPGQLTSQTAHAFNNVINAVTGFSQLGLARLDDRERVGFYLTEISRAGERAAAMTRELLAFGRNQTVEPRLLDVDWLVRRNE